MIFSFGDHACVSCEYSMRMCICVSTPQRFISRECDRTGGWELSSKRLAE